MATKTTTHPFGYEYEILFPGVRKLFGVQNLFGVEDRLVLEAERDGGFFVIEDLGVFADIHCVEFEDVVDEQVIVIEFKDVMERERYLDDKYLRERPWLRQRVDEARSRGTEDHGTS